MTAVATTTAYGYGQTLDEALAEIAATDAAVVELSIGVRPGPNPQQTLDRYADRFTFQAHHSAPILGNGFVRPSVTCDPRKVVPTLLRSGCSRYSAHPPHRKAASLEEMNRWALRWADILAAAGVHWSVETMYTPRTRREHHTSGGYHLSTPAEVWAFCDMMVAAGHPTPLLIDASHLHIGYAGRTWTERDVIEVLATAPAAGLHMSMNDGRLDEHRIAHPTDLTSRWAAPHLDRFEWVVDEGRRPAPATAGA